jgi:hypothetical protein
MKRNYIRATLKPGNEETLEKGAKEMLAPSPYYPLLKLVAQVLDYKAGGDNVWLTIGADKQNTTLLLVVHDGDVTYSAAGESLTDLSRDCLKLL